MNAMLHERGRRVIDLDWGCLFLGNSGVGGGKMRVDNVYHIIHNYLKYLRYGESNSFEKQDQILW